MIHYNLLGLPWTVIAMLAVFILLQLLWIQPHPYWKSIMTHSLFASILALFLGALWTEWHLHPTHWNHTTVSDWLTITILDWQAILSFHFDTLALCLDSLWLGLWILFFLIGMSSEHFYQAYEPWSIGLVLMTGFLNMASMSPWSYLLLTTLGYIGIFSWTWKCVIVKHKKDEQVQRFFARFSMQRLGALGCTLLGVILIFSHHEASLFSSWINLVPQLSDHRPLGLFVFLLGLVLQIQPNFILGWNPCNTLQLSQASDASVFFITQVTPLWFTLPILIRLYPLFEKMEWLFFIMLFGLIQGILALGLMLVQERPFQRLQAWLTSGWSFMLCIYGWLGPMMMMMVTASIIFMHLFWMHWEKYHPIPMQEPPTASLPRKNIIILSLPLFCCMGMPLFLGHSILLQILHQSFAHSWLALSISSLVLSTFFYQGYRAFLTMANTPESISKKFWWVYTLILLLQIGALWDGNILGLPYQWITYPLWAGCISYIMQNHPTQPMHWFLYVGHITFFIFCVVISLWRSKKKFIPYTGWKSLNLQDGLGSVKTFQTIENYLRSITRGCIVIEHVLWDIVLEKHLTHWVHLICFSCTYLDKQLQTLCFKAMLRPWKWMVLCFKKIEPCPVQTLCFWGIWFSLICGFIFSLWYR